MSIIELKYKNHETLRAKQFKEIVERGYRFAIEAQEKKKAEDRKKRLDKARVFNREQW